MLFVTWLKALPGRYEDAIRIFKHPKVPKNVHIHQFLGIFGEVDACLVFECPDEGTAAEFLIQFGSVAEVCTSLAFPIEKYKWTR